MYYNKMKGTHINIRTLPFLDYHKSKPVYDTFVLKQTVLCMPGARIINSKTAMFQLLHKRLFWNTHELSSTSKMTIIPQYPRKTYFVFILNIHVCITII